MAKPKPKQRLGFSAAEIKAMRGAQDKAEGSTPKAVLEALAPDAPRVGPVALQECCGTHIVLLHKTKNSLLGSDDPDRFVLDDLFQALALLSLDGPAARELVRSGQLQARADLIADAFPASGLKDLPVQLNAYVVDAFSTLVPHGQKGGDGGNFPAAAGPATAG